MCLNAFLSAIEGENKHTQPHAETHQTHMNCVVKCSSTANINNTMCMRYISTKLEFKNC